MFGNMYAHKQLPPYTHDDEKPIHKICNGCDGFKQLTQDKNPHPVNYHHRQLWWCVHPSHGSGYTPVSGSC
jgi:hypothetical protein